MIRRALIGCLLFAISACAGFYTTRRPATPIHRATLDGVYARVLPSVEIRKTTVGAAVNYLRQQTGVNIVANWPALKRDDIEPDTPYDPDLLLHDAAVWQVLDRLSHAGGWARTPLFLRPDGFFQTRSICFTKHDGYIQLETRDDPPSDIEYASNRRATITCQHPIADLLLKDGPWERLAVVHGNHAFTPPLTCDERETLLSQTIIALVDQESWRDEGGQTGAMRFMMGQLLVTQTAANQRAIDQVLQTLRTAH